MIELYERERNIAELVVQKAALITKKVLQYVDKGELKKGDKTSVSLADFACQALIVAAITNTFPEDGIIGEEDASELRTDSNMVNRVWELVSSTHLEDAESEELLQAPRSVDEMLRYIDLGGATSSTSLKRVWTIDPVDGTHGFLNGGQHVVCVSLLVDGLEKVAVFGCPVLSLEGERIEENDVNHGEAGYLLSSIKGKGVRIRPLTNGPLAPSRDVLPPKKVEDRGKIRFCDNIDSTKIQYPHRDKIAEKIGAHWKVHHLYSTQLRYIALTLDFTDVILRLPKPEYSQPHLWDHAGGAMMFEEVGGKVTDVNGRPLDFTAGRDLDNNFGLVAAPASIHAQLLEVIQSALLLHPEYATAITKPM
ncbi:hypothetical protein H072_9069 [Dactylellina haptotyla CBS 200.50]|uniref:3'(2'),5'-bisphosphate nucleotidase n=1 Tax=Dactylellina haptotyla (strain CBS 200.50) TaxID=1284197 RepID=S8A2Q4_DACHA|nr:hypothetical protein H072_9069 [Dactylellina haptotyla CBS 200.50]